MENKKPIISVMFPARGNASVVTNVLSNLYGRSSSKESIEVLIRFDEDDVETISHISSYTSSHPEQNIKILVGTRYGYSGIYKYLTELKEISSGSIFLFMNSSFIIKTQSWDSYFYPYVNSVSTFRCNVSYESFPCGHSIIGYEFVMITKVAFDLIENPIVEFGFDCYIERTSLLSGIEKNIDVDIEVPDLDITFDKKGWEDRHKNGVFFASATPLHERIVSNSSKIIKYMDEKNIFHNQDPRIYISFLDGAYIEIRGGWLLSFDMIQNNIYYNVKFINADNDSIVYESNLQTFCWSFVHNDYYINWLIVVTCGDKWVYSARLNLNKKDILIYMDSVGYEEMYKCVPYIIEFQKIYNCNITISSPHFKVLSSLYPMFKHEDAIQYNLGAPRFIDIPWFYTSYRIKSLPDCSIEEECKRILGLK